MSFQQQLLDAFDGALDVFRSDEADSCLIRLPVTKDGADVTGAANYDAIQAPTPDELVLITGGFQNRYKFSLTVRKADFANTAALDGMLFLSNGRVSRILAVGDKTAGVDISPVIILHCGDINE